MIWHCVAVGPYLHVLFVLSTAVRLERQSPGGHVVDGDSEAPEVDRCVEWDVSTSAKQSSLVDVWVL